MIPIAIGNIDWIFYNLAVLFDDTDVPPWL